MAYQLLLSARQEGVVLAFRRAESPMTSASFQLHGLNAASMYTFECADSGKSWQVSGQELMTKGLALSLDTPRTSRLLFYGPC